MRVKLVCSRFATAQWWWSHFQEISRSANKGFTVPHRRNFGCESVLAWFPSTIESQVEFYLQELYWAAVRETDALYNALEESAFKNEVVFSLLHPLMRGRLRREGRREPHSALSYWPEANSWRSIISPVLFNSVARAAFSLQTSLISAVRLFCDLRWLESQQHNSLLFRRLKLTKMFLVLIQNELRDLQLLQASHLHSLMNAF